MWGGEDRVNIWGRNGQRDRTKNINACNKDICNKTKDKRWVDNTIFIMIIGCIGQIGKK